MKLKAFACSDEVSMKVSVVLHVLVAALKPSFCALKSENC